ncbi:GNAT family N-acetyltransferase [Halobaculum marinum]|uniref:GNAT family N-acetyltransferase n=1 Tax=Halobaculum marinum TaxID=3031996 RepID=A0ABD5WW80_9EURY|nr:GNAT family N-acetyltransferase [Halobaculum sp. DT55]
MGLTQTQEQNQATIRPFEPGDTDGFLDLYEAVWGRRKSAEWFEWRFEANPYVDEVPMVVADADGQLAGAEPCVVFPLAVGDETVIAFQPADWMVHPDHRRRGLFTRMTERLLEDYADGPESCYYNFPSDAIMPGLKKLGWQEIGTVPTYYRIQDVERLAGARLSTDRLAAKGMLAIGQAGLSLARGVSSLTSLGGPSEYTVERHETVPAETLVQLYESGVPDRVHIRRDEAFYNWRFGNPRWETTTYLAKADGGVVASVIAATSDDEDLRRVWVLDTLPADGSAPADSYEALLSAVVEDGADADVLKCCGAPMPATVLGRCGFRPDDEFPLSSLSSRTKAVVRAPTPEDGDPVGREPWLGAGVDPTDGGAWAVQLCGRDVA